MCWLVFFTEVFVYVVRSWFDVCCVIPSFLLTLTIDVTLHTPLHTHAEVDVKSLSDEELNRQVFDSIADGKAFISVKDLRQWNLVHILLAQVLTICS